MKIIFILILTPTNKICVVTVSESTSMHDFECRWIFSSFVKRTSVCFAGRFFSCHLLMSINSQINQEIKTTTGVYFPVRAINDCLSKQNIDFVFEHNPFSYYHITPNRNSQALTKNVIQFYCQIQQQLVFLI